MRRLLFILSVFLLLFSCSPHLFVTQITTKNSLVDQQTATTDSVVEMILRPYRDSINHDMSKVICESETAIVKGKPESKLSNMVADILLSYGIEYCNSNKMSIKPDAAYVNYGGLRGSLPQGKITVGNIFELMPFENEIVLLKVSGSAIQKMAEKIAARGGEGVAGIKLGIRDGKVAKLLVHGSEVDPKAYYWLVTNDYIANGGDQMIMFGNPVDRKNTKAKIRDVIIKSLSEAYRNKGILSVKEDGRIYNEQ